MDLQFCILNTISILLAFFLLDRVTKFHQISLRMLLMTCQNLYYYMLLFSANDEVKITMFRKIRKNMIRKPSAAVTTMHKKKVSIEKKNMNSLTFMFGSETKIGDREIIWSHLS